MPRGLPDYQSYREPAIALQTMWADDFEAPESKWEVLATGGGATMVLSTERAWKGVQSAYLETAAVAGRWSQMRKYLSLIRPGKVGIEFWTNPSTFTPGYLSATMIVYDGTNLSTAELRLDSQERSARIVSGGVDELVASNIFFLNPLTAFTPVKLVVDTVTDMYVRLLIHEREIDLSAWPMAIGALTNDSVIDASLRLVGGVAGAQYAYIDDFIFTQNEP